ncbi:MULTISPECIES: bifunctional folylpolyglutamate synthase/dihydrofolate synthase [Atopobiaceae]|uniref:tetrahydrofolate synthase n=1 Tax=Parafannyhessea umbonata TaxID=604330 RepID=A0A1H6JJ51_9ACTN|nr:MULTISPECIES: Mur ligase family protein [Atopobiaceae]SEH59205.1 dihydrofolate synthase / folylpolyglutamate synthase [Parafannyhessea umbonata]SJZ52870.1 dihydrofolate synthase / folylpolyglutamate synthase [Olsenella sp. KH1P3]
MYQVPFDVEPLTFEESLGVLHSALRFGIQPMLESVEDMLTACGDPDLCFKCIQISGTNGKTSTARYTAAILAGEGLKVALYTSPELVSYNERMEICGAPIARDAFAHGIAVAREAGSRVNESREAQGLRPYDITEFDTLTVAAMVAFAEAQVDVAVLECGMGGRWDATSAAKSICSVAVTGVGLDHTRILGDTLEAIAGEKAAIIKHGRTCVLGVGTATPASVEDVFLDRCRDVGVTPVLLRPDRPFDAAGELNSGELAFHGDLPRAGYRISRFPGRIGGSLVVDIKTPLAEYDGVSALKPSYQAANVSCAIVLSEQFLGRHLDADALFDSVVTCPTPGRFDVVRPEPVGLIDACHNPQSVATFVSAVRGVEPDVRKRPVLLLAVLADKDVRGICRILAPEFPRFVVTKTQSPRALDEFGLARILREEGGEVEATYPSVEEALTALSDRPFVACGSITTAGEVSKILRGSDRW